MNPPSPDDPPAPDDTPTAPPPSWYRRDPVWQLFVVLLLSFFAFILTSVIVVVTGEAVAKIAMVARTEPAAAEPADPPPAAADSPTAEGPPPTTENQVDGSGVGEGGNDHAADSDSDGDGDGDERADQPAEMPAMYRSAWLFSLSVIVPQLAMVVPALLAVAMMVEPIRRRLGLVRGNWPIWLWVLAALGTLPVGMLSGLLVQWLVQPLLGESHSLNEMAAIFRRLGQDGGLLPLALVIGLTPGIFEELLFRGYLQTGLTRRWGAYGGILIASLLFAIFHLDPVHASGVLLIGVYLGWVYWASGSLIPAMLGHFFNNFFSVMAVVTLPQLDAGEVDLAAVREAIGPLLLLWLVILLSVLSLLLTFPAALYYRRRESLASG